VAEVSQGKPDWGWLSFFFLLKKIFFWQYWELNYTPVKLCLALFFLAELG
jgi:hypothetical protein